MKRRVVKQSSLSGGAGISGADIEAVSAKLVKPVFSSKRKQQPNQQEQNPETTNNNQNNTEQQKSFQQQQSVPPYQQQVPQPQYQPQMMPFGQQQMFPPYYFPPYFYQPNQDQNRLMQFILERETAFTKKDAYKMATMFNDKMNEEKKLDRILDAINGLNNKQINNHYHLLPFQQQPITSQPIIGPYNIQPFQSQPLIKPQIIRYDNTEEIENLRLENERLKRDLENEINNLMNVNKLLNDDNALLGNQIEQSNDKNNKLIQDNKTLRNEFNNLNANNQEKDSEINRLKGIIDNLQRQIGQLNSNIANNDNYKNLLEDKNNKINALKSNISNLETNIRDRNKKIQDLTNQLDDEKYKNSQLNNEYNELNGELSRIRNQMSSNGLANGQEIQNLKNQLQDEKNKLNEADLKARNKDNENRELKRENDILRNKISDLNGKLSRSPTQNTVDDLNNKIRELNYEIDNLRSKINTSPKQSDLDDLQNRLSNERKQNACLQDKYDSLNISLQNYKRNQNGMNDKYNNLNCENVELRNNNNDLKNQNNNYQQQLIEKDNEIYNLKNQLNGLNNQIRILKLKPSLEPIQEEPIAVEFRKTPISTPQIAQQTKSRTQTPMSSQTTSLQYNRNIPNNCYSSRKDETAEEILKDKIFFGIPSMPKYLFMYDLKQNDLFVNEGGIVARDHKRLMSEQAQAKNHTNKDPIVFFDENCGDYIDKIRNKLFNNVCNNEAKTKICKQFIEQTRWANRLESKKTYPTTWLSRSEKGGSLILNEEHDNLIKKVCDNMMKMGYIDNKNISRERYGNEIPVAVSNNSDQPNNNFDIINYQQRHKNPLTSTGLLNKMKDRKGAMHYIMNNNSCANNIYSNNIRNIKLGHSQYSRGNFNNKYNYYK